MKKYDLKLGFSCNNDCIHCVVGSKRSEKDLTIQEIIDLIDKNNDCTDFIITGGEPTIRPDLNEILDYLISKHHKIHLQTNGMAFSDEKYTEKIAPKLNSILIAIHSNIKEDHDFIVKTNGAFDKTIKGFQNLVNIKAPVRTQTVITKYNFKNLLNIADMIQNICKGTLMNLTFPHLLGNAWKNRKDIVVSYVELKPYLKQVLEKYSNYIFTEALPICSLYPYHFDVYNQDYYQLLENIKGFDKYASTHYQNDKNYNNLGEMKNYVVANLQNYIKCEECKKCKAFYFCFGTWKEYFDVFPKGIVPLEQFSI